MGDLEKFWDVEYDGELLDFQFNLTSHAQTCINAIFSEDCDDGELKNGEVRTSECELVQYYYNYAGVKIEVMRKKHYLEYEHYHGDFAEHNTCY